MNQDEVRRHWAGRTGEYSPEYYAYYGRDETSEAVRRTVERHVDRDAAVLEVGCSCGRHLAHLRDAGFEDLTGIELNPEAFEVMAESYPDLAETGSFHCGAVEEFVGEFADDRFDVVYSVETLQHIHPDADWVFEELARVAGELLVTVEVESPVDDPSADEEGATGGDPDTDPDGTPAPTEREAGGAAAGTARDDSGAELTRGEPGRADGQAVTDRTAGDAGSGGPTGDAESGRPGADAEPDRPAEGTDRVGADAGESTPRTNYVHGEFPLYYRDWGEVFTSLGLVEVERRTHRRDTIRAFRPGPAAAGE